MLRRSPLVMADIATTREIVIHLLPSPPTSFPPPPPPIYPSPCPSRFPKTLPPHSRGGGRPASSCRPRATPDAPIPLYRVVVSIIQDQPPGVGLDSASSSSSMLPVQLFRYDTLALPALSDSSTATPFAAATKNQNHHHGVERSSSSSALPPMVERSEAGSGGGGNCIDFNDEAGDPRCRAT